MRKHVPLRTIPHRHSTSSPTIATEPPLSCPSCSGEIEKDPGDVPPPPRSQVTLRCTNCGRFARYIAGAA